MEKTPENAAFAKLLGEEFTTDEERKQFERDVAKLVASAEVIAALEQVREARAIPKAEVARRIGTERSVVARLLSGQTTNATMARVVEIVGAMDCYSGDQHQAAAQESCGSAPSR